MSIAELIALSALPAGRAALVVWGLAKASQLFHGVPVTVGAPTKTYEEGGHPQCSIGAGDYAALPPAGKVAVHAFWDGANPRQVPATAPAQRRA
jgi:hypothetical protein